MFVAQYYGKRDFDGLRTSAGLVLRYVFIISILFLLAAFFIPEIAHATVYKLILY